MLVCCMKRAHRQALPTRVEACCGCDCVDSASGVLTLAAGAGAATPMDLVIWMPLPADRSMVGMATSLLMVTPPKWARRRPITMLFCRPAEASPPWPRLMLTVLAAAACRTADSGGNSVSQCTGWHREPAGLVPKRLWSGCCGMDTDATAGWHWQK